MILTILLIIVLTMINAPAWTFVIAGVGGCLQVINFINTLCRWKKLKAAIDEMIKALEEF